jgi:hypothetical protein
MQGVHKFHRQTKVIVSLRNAEGGEAISQPARRLLRRARNALLAATRDFVKTVELDAFYLDNME